MAGPIAKEISDEFHISPKRSASLLDIFASVGQGVIPYGAQLLTAAGMAAISPVEIMPYLYYPILMGISAVLFYFVQEQEKLIPSAVVRLLGTDQKSRNRQGCTACNPITEQ